MLLVALLVALVATIAVIARRRRNRRAAPAPVQVPAAVGAESSLWPAPDPTQHLLEPTEYLVDATSEPDAPSDPDEPGAPWDDRRPRREEGWRVRVPFAEPLSARLTPDAPDAPAELVARFEALSPAAAADEVVASLADLGYEVRWRRPAELALGSADGQVARVLVESRPEGGATVGVELEPDEVAEVAVGLLERLLARGHRLDRREATTVVLRDPDGAAVRVTRVPTVRA